MATVDKKQKKVTVVFHQITIEETEVILKALCEFREAKEHQK
jgi:hypothetical protein